MVHSVHFITVILNNREVIMSGIESGGQPLEQGTESLHLGIIDYSGIKAVDAVGGGDSEITAPGVNDIVAEHIIRDPGLPPEKYDLLSPLEERLPVFAEESTFGLPELQTSNDLTREILARHLTDSEIIPHVAFISARYVMGETGQNVARTEVSDHTPAPLDRPDPRQTRAQRADGTAEE
jgi:hypothetical protein